MISGVYEVVNKISGKRYIGSATDIEYRFYCHKIGKNSNKELQLDIERFGIENFDFCIIIEIDNEQEMKRLERELIENEDSTRLYNITYKYRLEDWAKRNAAATRARTNQYYKVYPACETCKMPFCLPEDGWSCGDE